MNGEYKATMAVDDASRFSSETSPIVCELG